jgi:acetyltransferase-like isoleucine patch superfamily enzyme
LNNFHQLIEKFRQNWLIFRQLVRGRLLRARGATVGHKVRIGKGVTVDNPWTLSLGNRVFIENNVYLKIVSDNAIVEIGDFTFIGQNSELDVDSNVKIGARSLIAPGCFITDHNHGIEAHENIDEQPCESVPVSIGSGVWLGANSVILPGATIGNGAVVGANSVVTRDVEAMDVVAGVPAKKIKSRLDR